MKVKPFLKDIKQPEVVKTGDQDGWRYDDWSELRSLKQEATNGEGLGGKQEQCVQDSRSE